MTFGNLKKENRDRPAAAPSTFRALLVEAMPPATAGTCLYRKPSEGPAPPDGSGGFSLSKVGDDDPAAMRREAARRCD